MTLSLNLPPSLEKRMADEANRQGLAMDAYVLRILDNNVPAEGKRARAIALLQSWMDEDDGGEQKETLDYLIKVLDEDRPSERKLFPPEMKGKTW